MWTTHTLAARHPRLRTALIILLTILAIVILAAVTGYGPLGASRAGVPIHQPSNEIIGQEIAMPAAPPAVPTPIRRTHATKVIVRLDVVERPMPIADSVTYPMWTFGGTVPSRFIRVREGDLVELHLKHAANSTMPHHIDLHAVTGPGGGAKASLTLPGQESVFTFSAMNPGLYVYHCATSPVRMHMANGMYGMVLVAST